MKEPLTLRAGDFFSFTGEVLVFRDRLQKLLLENRLRRNLAETIVYYCGPVLREGRILSCGPTTISRMEEGIPGLVERGVRGFIGKGRLSPSSLKKKAFYFMTVGGAGACLARKISSFKVLARPGLGPEALYSFSLREFPLLVAVDLTGKSVYT
ncbi:MAG TPA: fumarate hydratase C-terminal domain-containing protein [bacterium]|nr:fumarate hydratase C-terminal domain-containing protein [bacterium]